MESEAEAPRLDDANRLSEDIVEVDGSPVPPTKYEAAQQVVGDFSKDIEFWLEDGTVVLLVRGVGFRVYEGWLADASPVLKELFVRRSNETLWFRTGGRARIHCAVVPLDDTPEDWRHLLRMCMPWKSLAAGFVLPPTSSSPHS